MKFQTFPTLVNDATKEPMFFGNSVNVARYDKQKYKFFESQIKKMMSFFWVPEEIPLDLDSGNFKSMSPAAQHIFTSNLKYQILLDSVQGRAPNIALLPFVSIPELETLIEVWSFTETIHSRSYTHIIRGIYNTPGDVLDNILVPEIVERAQAVTKYYDDFIEYANWYNMLGYGVHNVNGKEIVVEEKELLTKMYLMIGAINILEGIRFYVSFACTWAFAESLKIMEKSAKIIGMICRDENVHLAITSFMLKKFSDGSEGPLMKEIAKVCEPQLYKMYDDAVQQEKSWADYLFKDGSIVGLNADILKNYVEFICNKRMRTIGLKGPYQQPSNPLPWTEHWISSKGNQVAPQEEEITSYLIGTVDNDANKDSFTGFEL